MLLALNPLDRVTSDPSRAGIFCDFDGTLSAIVDRPEDARPVPGAAEALSGLSRVFGLVAVISGRSLDDLRSRFAPDGVLLAGSYGRDRSDRPGGPPKKDWEHLVAAAVERTREWDGVRIEPKDTGVAIHYRLAPERAADVDALATTLAVELHMELRPGRKVVELTEPGPGKADALAGLVTEHALGAFLFAGDDLADGEAFKWARSSGRICVLVGVRSAESPEVIERDADITVDDPKALVGLLNGLLRQSD
jgi:trehalose 6-phosphate phosphatase